jgi:hypothetical protein
MVLSELFHLPYLIATIFNLTGFLAAKLAGHSLPSEMAYLFTPQDDDHAIKFFFFSVTLQKDG